MMRFIFPLTLLLLAGGIFGFFIDPTYTKIKQQRADKALYDEALNNSKELQSTRDVLTTEYNAFPQEDLEKLEKILPNNVDNVRLIRDLDGIAARYGMSLRNTTVDVGNGAKTGDQIPVDDGTFGTVTIHFTVTASYRTFIAFLKDLERSLRILDVTDVSFTSSQNDFYQYKVSLKTYWIK